MVGLSEQTLGELKMKKLWQTQMPVQVEAVAWDLLVQSLEHYRQEEKADDCGWEVPDFLVV